MEHWVLVIADLSSFSTALTFKGIISWAYELFAKKVNRWKRELGFNGVAFVRLVLLNLSMQLAYVPRSCGTPLVACFL